jgi:hypothetical protein
LRGLLQVRLHSRPQLLVWRTRESRESTLACAASAQAGHPDRGWFFVTRASAEMYENSPP